jgi:serine O-acetyltransferase
MIRSKEDLEFYLEADRIALGKERKHPKLLGDEVWRFQIALRRFEFYRNTRRSIFWKPWYMLSYFRFAFWSGLLGFTISSNVFGPGLSIAHRGTLVVGDNVSVGANCRIHVCVNIGTQAGFAKNHSPKIGNNVYIGPGAKIFGDIRIADDISIGANSVVNESFLEKGIGIAGVPARKINDLGSQGLLIKATEVISQREQSVASK